ncbi:MAG: TonB-dependent receptor plug domain-containing protein, partial [Methyloprofundus sp.]|nr:TonB-dependent receptor plug domain-containing protein [Methyloprofundus sp.]
MLTSNNIFASKHCIFMRKLLFPLSITIFSLSVAYAETDPSMDSLLKVPFDELVDMEIISATKIATKLSATPSTVTTYDYKEIKALGARTLSDILVLVPGIHIQVKGNNRQKLWVRGVQSEFNNKVAMYIDNIPVRNAFNEFPIDEELPIESIKKIEIIRGPGSALYGANAFAAVINIFTFQAGEREENLVKFGIGEADTILGYFSAGTNLSDIADVVLEGKWLTTEGRQPNYDRKGIENSRSGEQQLGHIRFKLSALDKDLLFSASYNNFENTRVDKSEPIENDREYESLRFSLAYAHQFNHWGIDFNTYYTQSTRLETETRFPQLGNIIQTRESQFIDRTELTGAYATINYQAFESNQLVLGVDVKWEHLMESKFSNSLSDEVFSFVKPTYQNLSLLDTGFFLQDSQYFFDKKTQLTLGIRYDVLELFDNQFSYRIGLTHAFTDTISAKLLYGTAYRSPSFLEFTRSPEGSELPDVETMQTIEAQIG